MKPYFRYFAWLVAISLAMGVMQWLAAPEGYGASGWAHALPQMGHPTVGNMLRWLSDKAESVRGADHALQHVINAPRNKLLRGLGAIELIDFYAISERVGYWPDVRDALVLIVGTVIVYLPLVIGVALIRQSGWQAMKEPVLVSSLVFIIVGIGFLTVSKSDEQSKLAVILTALPLLTAAVGSSWSPLLSRRSRFAALASLLIICSTLKMFTLTKGSAPRDALSYPVSFGWSLIMLALEGGSFLLLVWLLLRMKRRLRGNALPSQ